MHGRFTQMGRDRCRCSACGKSRGQRGRGQDHAATNESAPQPLTGTGHSAADRAMRATEAPRRLVDRKSVEIAQDHRQAEGSRQPLDLLVQQVSLLAGQAGLLGRRSSEGRLCIQNGAGLFMVPAAAAPNSGTPGSTKGDAIKPIPEQVRVTDRVRSCARTRKTA